jgi:hypothetical protein
LAEVATVSAISVSRHSRAARKAAFFVVPGASVRLQIEQALPPIDTARLRPAVRDRLRVVAIRRCQVRQCATTGTRCPSHVGMQEAA